MNLSRVLSVSVASSRFGPQRRHWVGEEVSKLRVVRSTARCVLPSCHLCRMFLGSRKASRSNRDSILPALTQVVRRGPCFLLPRGL